MACSSLALKYSSTGFIMLVQWEIEFKIQNTEKSVRRGNKVPKHINISKKIKNRISEKSLQRTVLLAPFGDVLHIPEKHHWGLNIVLVLMFFTNLNSPNLKESSQKYILPALAKGRNGWKLTDHSGPCNTSWSLGETSRSCLLPRLDHQEAIMLCTLRYLTNK